MKLNGIFPSIPTPFNHSGELYIAKIRHNIEKWNLTSVAGFVVAGAAGEDVYLSETEKPQLWEEVAKYTAKVLIAGVTMESVRGSVSLANIAAGLGYRAVLVQAPRHYQVDPNLYFRAVADGSKIPVLAAAGLDHPNILPSPEVGSRDLYRHLRNGATAAIFDYASAAPFSCLTIAEAVQKREYEAAEDWQSRIDVAVGLVTRKYGIPGLKYAMDYNGYYGGPTRLPLAGITSTAQREIEQAFHGLRG